MSERIIKKYSNRRLYDTEQSRYISLDDLKEMILDGTEFRVLTTKNEDITSPTLISILMSSEVMGQPVFSEQNLRSMVMFMHGPMRGVMRVFLEQCMPLFVQTQQQLVEKYGADALGQGELENLAVLQGTIVRQLMEQYVCRGMENYLSVQKNMENAMKMQPFTFPAAFNPMDIHSFRPKDKD